MDHLRYLLLLAGCLAVTLPLELSGSRVYRRPGRLARAVLPAAVAFLAWDVVAIAAGVWWYDPRYLAGIVLPLAVPLEEALFFLVVPVCAVLTFETVRRMLPSARGGGRKAARAPHAPSGPQPPGGGPTASSRPQASTGPTSGGPRTSGGRQVSNGPRASGGPRAVSRWRVTWGARVPGGRQISDRPRASGGPQATGVPQVTRGLRVTGGLQVSGGPGGSTGRRAVR